MKQLIALLLVTLFIAPATGAGYTDGKRVKADVNRKAVAKQPDIQKLKLKISVSGKTFTADFVDSKTTREFINLLPLSLILSDINDREKYSGLPAKLSGEGAVSTSYKIGDLSYWLGGGIAAFYNHDGREVKAGLIVLAKLEKNVDLFNVAGSVKVTFDVAKN